ncbi:MAG: phosphate ABC transporter permease PstA [Eubacteriales bacterium]
MIKKIKQYSFYTGVGLLSALAMLSLLLIIGYILLNGLSHVNLEFLTQEPSNMGKDGGVLSVIVGTLYLTFFAVLIATPIGVAAAIFFTEYSAGKKWVSIIRFFTEILAGIPSIIFGLFGFSFFVVFLGFGWSILSGGLTLAMMILPTLIRATEESLKTVPMAYREGSLSLGASKLQTITRVIIPSCLPGILTGLILGIGRAIGETAAVVLTCGSNLKMPTSLFDSTRTLSVHLYTLASEGLSLEKTYATATLLIIIVLIINTAANAITSKYIIKS